MPKKKEHRFVNGIEYKSCSGCKDWFTLDSFQKNTNFSWDGLSGYCKECSKVKNNAKYLKRRTAVAKRSKEYYQENKSSINQRNKIYVEKHKDVVSQYKSNWQKENGERRRIRLNERYKNEPNFRIAVNLRTRILSAIGNNQKAGSTLEVLGCSVDFFKNHISSMFVGEMSWSNHGSVWHIDHIKPCAKFDLSNETEQRVCFHYTNMQPLFVLDNLRKGDR